MEGGDGETAEVLYHGKLKGVITPASSHGTDGKIINRSVEGHPFFGSNLGEDLEISTQMNELRGSRYELAQMQQKV